MDYRFTNEFSPSKIDEIVHYMAGPRLWVPESDYPDFFDWTQKVHAQLKDQTKRAVIALSGADVIGVSLYQRHKHHSDTLEIKNLSVRPDARGRYIASFLLRNTEIQGAQDFSVSRAICDAKATNLSILYFLQKHRYAVTATRDLYGLQAGDDHVYIKQLSHPA